MQPIERTFHVAHTHRVVFTRHVFAAENELLAGLLTGHTPDRPAKVLAALDAGLCDLDPSLPKRVEAYWAAHSRQSVLVCPPMILPGGERAKADFDAVSELHTRINRCGIDRHSYCIAVGGGAFLDMVGLAAATAHRGIRLVRLPTTTLAQADSGVGVKNGINAFGKKNFIGTFAVPYAVVNDFEFLRTLAPRDKRAGFIEAIKVACIRDRSFFDALEAEMAGLSSFDPGAMERLIHRCAQLHVDHITTGGDPFESGSARPLDFGHWSAHKLEPLSEFQLRHGEAVAIGIALDVVYSKLKGFLPPDAAERILRLIEGLGFSLYAPELDLKSDSGELVILRGLEEFREHLGGRLSITLLEAIGKGFEAQAMDPAAVLAAIAELRSRPPRKN